MKWPLVTLADVATINPRIPKGKELPDEVAFLPMAAVSEQGEIFNSELRPLAEVRKGFTYFERGDVLLAKITPCFENGKAAFLDTMLTEVGFGSTEFHVIRPNADALDGKYLFYLLWNAKFRHEGESNMTGSAGQRRVPTGFLERYTFFLPPLATQKHIARVLEQADQLRKQAQQMESELNQLAQSLFLEMFGDPVTNPKSWDMRPIKEVSTVTTGNTPSRAKPEYYGEYIEWIKSDNINTPSHYLTAADEHLSEAGAKVGRTVNAGSVLMTCIAGSPDCIGNVAIADRRVAFNQQINAITPCDGTLSTDFFYMLCVIGKKLIQKASTNSMKGMVSKGNLEKVCIPVPPFDRQKEFERNFSTIRNKVNACHAQVAECEDIFNALMQRAFKGELTAPGSKAA